MGGREVSRAPISSRASATTPVTVSMVSITVPVPVAVTVAVAVAVAVAVVWRGTGVAACSVPWPVLVYIAPSALAASLAAPVAWRQSLPARSRGARLVLDNEHAIA